MHLETAIKGLDVVLLQDIWTKEFPCGASGSWNKVYKNGTMVLSKFPIMYEDTIVFGGTLGKLSGLDSAVYCQLGVDTERTDAGLQAKHRIHVVNVRLKQTSDASNPEKYRQKRLQEMQELVDWIIRVTREAEVEEFGEHYDSDEEDLPSPTGKARPKCFGSAGDRVPEHRRGDFKKKRPGLRWPLLIGGNFNIDALSGVLSTDFVAVESGLADGSHGAAGCPGKPRGSHEYMETTHLLDQVGVSWFEQSCY